MSIDILAIGEPLVEFNQTRPGAPEYLQGYGGDTSNMIVAAARSGARCAYVTHLGDDAFGRMFLELWRAEGVDTGGVAIDRAAPTGAYIVTHGPQGHVFSYLRAGSAASRMRAADLPHALLRSAKIVQASGISLAVMREPTEAALAAATGRIAIDSNLRLKLWPLEAARAAIGAAAARADYFFPSLEDARALSGKDEEGANLDWAHGLGAKNVFLKLGAGGVWVSDGRRHERIAGHNVEAVDATGAGDCFCGAALARLIAGDSIWEAARYANAAAALATCGYGAVAPLPRAEAVRGLLATSPG